LLEEHQREVENALWALDNGYDAVGIDGADLVIVKGDYFEIMVEKTGNVSTELNKRRADADDQA
jgi:hypothetical protein